MLRKLLYTFSLLLPLFLGATDHNLSVAALFRDDAPYLKEWIEYHQLIGVEHFYLYNNLSEDGYAEVLQPYIENGTVELFDWPVDTNNVFDFCALQREIYKDAVKISTGRTTWLAIIDTDEFLVPQEKHSIPELLSPYEKSPQIGGIGMIWVCFGTSNVPYIPQDKLMIELLTWNEGLSCNGNISAVLLAQKFKSIVRPERVKEIRSPHFCDYDKGFKHIMLKPEHGVINHYWTRDEDFFFNHKIPRGEKWGFSASSYIKRAAKMVHTNHYSENMRPFIPALKQRMNLP